MKRDTKPVVDLEKPRTSDDLNKDTLVNLFGPDYLEELEDLDEEDDFEEEEEEVQTSSPSPPPQPSQPKRVKIPISTDPLEKTCIEKDPLPAGYIFVRRGDVYITRHCRSKTKDSKRTVYLVYDAKGKRTLGIRVPKDIYHSVRSDAVATASSRADAVKVRDERDLARSRKLLLAQFPKMPPSSLERILEHAFLKGSGRVGRSTKRSDERKAELAVEAHIRHLHTPYEELLDQGMQRDQARDRVWDAVQEVKAAWGGQRRDSPLPSKRIKRKRRTKAPGTKVAKKAKKK
ncbi:hypothetical protein DTO164E3_7630 [Paecilomyces variotii]|nr:hypothetical protein DTO164E3_7630 [Paecilomyces variotii]KAJ9194832.1 hypothetical protein DTO032I3_7162 [Paecilomyces variotii]KAJ9261359.1 hypothetical protein DTO195F2_4155 [Paecilomyces variotii]KAJ9275525.1 hypothetical protein DTO021D3_7587 [Paecilomyces variotii]KAJ9310199.1 hypothetical protein DTO217A2_485 [Paecilomyces variotii]